MTGARDRNGTVAFGAGDGIELFDVPTVTIQGNVVGLNASQTAALPNVVDGVFVCGCVGTVIIGGTAPAAPNVISGNGEDGIFIDGTSGAVIIGNRVGTNFDVSPSLGNLLDGIRLTNGTSAARVGGTTEAEQNWIVSNGANGLSVVDVGDADTVPNDLQNFPTILAATNSEAGTFISGALFSTASDNFAMDLYASTACDPSGFGEGHSYLGFVLVTTDATGAASFSGTFGVTPTGVVITGSATRNSGGGSTSEFSACLAAVPMFAAAATPTPTPTPTLPTIQQPGEDARGRNRDADHPDRTEEQQQQDQTTDQYGLDDYRTEGNVVAVGGTYSETGEATITLPNKDGLVTIVLRCKPVCADTHIGDYVTVTGEKVHEQLYIADSISVLRPR